MAENKTIAVLIDGENIDPSFADKIFSYANSLGSVAVREIYGSGVALNDWSDPILRHTIHTNFTLRPNRFKNSSDIALVIGAMELLASSRVSGEGPGSTAVLIVSSDSDFSPLAVHLRAAGMDVIGMGEPKNTNAMWPKACTRFVQLTSAQSQNAAKTEGRAADQEKKAAQKTSENPPAPQPQPQPEKKSAQQQPQPAPAPIQPEKKSAPAVQQPAQTGGQNDADRTAAERNEKTIAPSHRARVEIIRKFVEEQIAAHDGRIKSGELFKALVALPDYKYDQQRSRRNPLDYLEKQYGDWFDFEAGEKGSSWITVKSAAVSGDSAPDASAQEPVNEPAPAPAAAAEQEPERSADDAPGQKPEQEPPHELTLEESLTAAGIPFKDAVRAANILPRCRNMRDVYNRMRGAFGKEDGKTYYEAVKVLVKTSVFSFPEREKEETVPADKSDLPLTKEEILAMTATPEASDPSDRTDVPAQDETSAAEEPDSAEDSPEEDEPSSGSPRLTDGPVRFLMERGVTSDRAVRIVSIFNESPNQRVTYNELRKAFGNKGRQYLGMMKEYKGENA